MDSTSRVTLNGVITKPQEMTISVTAVDYDSGRTADGSMHRNMIGTKRAVKLQYPPMDTATIRSILNAVSGVSFTASFPDPASSNGVYTGEFYVGDRSAPVYNFALDVWKNVSFDIIEM